MRRIVIISSALVLAASATSFALTRPSSIQAEDKPPIVVTVENHEKRIGDLETKTDDIQTQVNQNSSDISNGTTKPASEKGQTNTVIERVTTVVEKSAPLVPADYPITPNNPAPTPPVVVNPLTLTKVSIEITTPNSNGLATEKCYHTFYSGQIVTTSNSIYLDANGNEKYTTHLPVCPYASQVGTVPNNVTLKALGLL